MWRIRWAPNNASKWQMGFNSAFKGLKGLVNKANWCTIFLNMFISFLYMFRATMCTSSGEITLSVRHLVFFTLCGWLSGIQGMHTRQSSTQNNKHQVSHRYSYFSWWWAHSRPKHLEKRNKYAKKKWAPILF